jgi:hypothetical protein
MSFKICVLILALPFGLVNSWEALERELRYSAWVHILEMTFTIARVW